MPNNTSNIEDWVPVEQTAEGGLKSVSTVSGIENWEPVQANSQGQTPYDQFKAQVSRETSEGGPDGAPQPKDVSNTPQNSNKGPWNGGEGPVGNPTGHTGDEKVGYPNESFLNATLHNAEGALWKTFVKPLKKAPEPDMDQYLDNLERKHPIAAVVGGTAPFIATSFLFPQSLIPNAYGRLAVQFAAVGAAQALGHEKLDEPNKPAIEKAKTVALETAKSAAYSPIFAKAQAIKIIQRPFATALAQSGLIAGGSTVMSAVFGQNITEAFKQGGLLGALSLIMHTPSLAKTVIGRGITAQANTIYADMGSKAGWPEVKIDPDSPKAGEQAQQVTERLALQVKGVKEQIPEPQITFKVDEQYPNTRHVMDQQGQAVGKVQYGTKMSEEGLNININPDFHGRGYGRAAIREVFKTEDSIEGSVGKDNLKAQSFWKGLGGKLQETPSGNFKLYLDKQSFIKAVGSGNMPLAANAGAESKFLAPPPEIKIVNPETLELIKKQKEVIDHHEGVYQKAVNRFQSIENLTARAKAFGVEVKAGEDPGLAATRYLSTVNQADTVLNKGTYVVDQNGNVQVTGEGLRPIINEFDLRFPKGEADLVEYLKAKRTIEDLQRDRKSQGEGEDIRLYRGGENLDITKVTENDISLSLSKDVAKNFGPIKDYAIKKDAKILKFEDIPKIFIKKHDSGFLKGKYDVKTASGIGKTNFEDLVSYAKEHGYDAIDLRKFGEGEMRVLNPEVIVAPRGGGIATLKQIEDAGTTLTKLQDKYGPDMAAFETTATRLYGYQQRMLDLLVDSGRLSPEVRSRIVEQNAHYVPFDRVFEEAQITDILPQQKNRFTKVRSPIKAIQGSERAIHNPIESMIKNTYTIMDSAARNRVFNDVYRLKDVGGLDIKEVGPKAQGHIIEGYINGEFKRLEVSENLKQAMTGLNEQSSSLLIKMLSMPANTLRVGATITPEFMLRNPIRDQWTALLQTQVGFKPFIDSTRALADVMKKSDVYDEWIRSGGSYAGFVELSRPNLSRMLGELKGQENHWKKLNIISHAQALSQVMEQATRLGVFKAAKDKGLSSIEAAKVSRESTLDFNRRGSQTKELNAMVAFFNAGIQGLDKSIRAAKADPKGLILKAAATITIPSFLLYQANRQEKDYFELPRWQRDLFWMFKMEGQWYRIPKPFMYGQLFGSLPERFFEYLDTSDASAFDKFQDSMYNSLSPVAGDAMSGLLPTALKPLLENTTNWSFFRERPLVSPYKLDLLPAEQSNKYDSETAKALGQALNVSPSKIENLVTGYLGGSGKYALQGGDALIKAVKEANGETVKAKRPTEASDLPLVKGFTVRDPIGSTSESVQKFYENKDRITKVHNTIKKLEKENAFAKVSQLKTDNPDHTLYKAINNVNEHIRKLEKRIDTITAGAGDDEGKSIKIKELEQQKTDLSKTINERIKLHQK